METIINKLPEDINYMFYIKHRGDKRFSTYNPGKGTMGTGLVFTELYRKEHLLAICKWIAEDNSGEWIYQLRSAGGKKIYWEYDSISATPTETPQISTETAETVNVSVEGEKETEGAICAFISKAETTLDKIRQKCLNREIYVEDANRYEFMVCMAVSNFINKHKNSPIEPPQSPGTPQTAECIVKNDKSDTRHAKAIIMLNTKLAKLQKEAHKYDDRNCLPRKLYFSDAKRQVRIGEQCTAIGAALDILSGKQWHELDIYNIVLMSVNSLSEEKDKMLEYAYSGGLYEKQKALMYAFETSLPICKKQIFEAIQMQIKNSRLAQTA